MSRKSRALTCLAILATTCGASISSRADAQAPTGDAVLRVVDVGVGLCVVITVPGGHAMLYDAGGSGGLCLAAVQEMVPSGSLELLVLSHSDDDHIGAMRDILGATRVATIIHPGDDHPFTRPRNGGRAYLELMRDDIASETQDVWDFAGPGRTPTPGQPFAIGTATATFVAGWSDGNATRHADEGSLPRGPRNNALSIVIRFEYGGHSVLLTGDTVGRLDYSPPATCAYAERIMFEGAARVPINSDVLVGQHHGADNASSGCFIRAVSPRYVVFSAGHNTNYHHPRESTYRRLIANGVPENRILRTDRDDNEGGTVERGEMRSQSGRCRDRPGDDDVEIRLPASRSDEVTVRYRGDSRPC